MREVDPSMMLGQGTATMGGSSATSRGSPLAPKGWGACIVLCSTASETFLRDTVRYAHVQNTELFQQVSAFFAGLFVAEYIYTVVYTWCIYAYVVYTHRYS